MKSNIRLTQIFCSLLLSFSLILTQTYVSVFAREQESNAVSAVELYKKSYQAVVEIKAIDEEGGEKISSGFFIDTGEILTSYHNIEGMTRIEIFGYDESQYKVLSVIDYSEKYDLAVLEVKTDDNVFLEISKEPVETGMTVYTIGSPLKYTSSFSEGIVSYAKRKLDGVRYIQMTAPTSMGSGGSPLLNKYGEVVGVNVMTVPDAQNINFAIPIARLTSMKGNNKVKIGDFYSSNKTGIKKELVSNEKVTDPVEVYKKSSVSVVEITGTDGVSNYIGSGFFIAPNQIVTNYHVLEPLKKAKIQDYSGKEYTLDGVYDYRKGCDLVVLHVKEKGHPLTISEETLEAGATIYAIGSMSGYTGSFTRGIVANASRRVEGIQCIQMTAPIYMGNSGGPLLNQYGEVIGINTFGQLNGQNLSFSVKISYLDKLNLKTWEPIDV